MKSIKGILLGLLAFVALRYALSYGVRSLVTSASSDKAICLTMVGNTTREEEGQTYIVGAIRNNCNRRIDHVTINFKLDRPAGSSLGLSEFPAYAYIHDLPSGETRQFKTVLPVGKNTIYRYAGMTAY